MQKVEWHEDMGYDYQVKIGLLIVITGSKDRYNELNCDPSNNRKSNSIIQLVVDKGWQTNGIYVATFPFCFQGRHH